ncbi:hypothetical protein PISMIDRAFT_118861, partial [Pisolithus microcarpus 441]
VEVNLALQGMKTHPVPSQPRYFHGKEVGIKAGLKQTVLLTPGVLRVVGSSVLWGGMLVALRWFFGFVLACCVSLARWQAVFYPLVVHFSPSFCCALCSSADFASTQP